MHIFSAGCEKFQDMPGTASPEKLNHHFVEKLAPVPISRLSKKKKKPDKTEYKYDGACNETLWF